MEPSEFTQLKNMEFNWHEPERNFPKEPVRPLRIKEPMQNLVYDKIWQLWEYRFEGGRTVYTFMQVQFIQGTPYL